MKWLRAVCPIAAWAAMGLCALALAVFGIGPLLGKYRVLTVLSPSMRPGMPEGSVVVVTPMPANSVRIGDVITFAAPDDHRIVTHRVVQIVEAGDEPVVRTKGDANNAPDPWDAQLLGGTVWKKRFSIPKLGYGMVWLRNPKVLPLTLAFLPFLCLIAWIIEIWWNHEPEVSLPPMQLSYVAQDFLPHRR